MSSRATDIAPKMPHSLEAEKAVLGAALLDNTALAAVMGILEPEDFFLREHIHIYSQMVEMYGRGTAIDTVLLMDALSVAGELEAAGGVAYISSLPDGLPHATNIAHYAAIVKDDSCRRTALYRAQAILQAGFNRDEDISKLQKRFADTADLLRRTNGAQKEALRTYTPAELSALVPEPIEILAYPLAYRGMLAVLDGQAKAAGKTTLILHAIRANLSREAFLGRATKKANVLYVTEEYRRTFILALNRADLSAETSGLHIITHEEWSGIPWPTLAERIEEKCKQLDIGFLVVDTFYSIVGLTRESEQNDAGLVDTAAAPLRHIAGKLDLAALTSRHERKSGGSIGESGRGSTALTGAADVVLRLQRIANTLPGVRELEITGRIDADILTVELVDGKYIIRGGDVRQSTQDDADTVARAITANPKASIRQLSEHTGVGRKRIEKLAADCGWTLGKFGWDHSNDKNNDF